MTAADSRMVIRDLKSKGETIRSAILELVRDGRPNLDDGACFEKVWGSLSTELTARPIFEKGHLSGLREAGHVLLRFGEDLFPEETCAKTPLTRLRHPGDPPLNANFDYFALMVARQLTLLLPEQVSGVHMMEQLYGGRLITDIVPEAGEHMGHQGVTKSVDHTREVEHAMHLHCDDADHHLRPPLQLLCGVKNQAGTATTLAVIPPDEVLRSECCDPEILRQPRYKHCPPKICRWREADVPPRPVLFGPASMPMVQADAKGILPLDEEARVAWVKLHDYLLRELQEVVVRPGDVLVVDNYRGLHGRAELQPMERLDDRRWVKRIWLSPAAGETELAACQSSGRGHPRILDRDRAFEAGICRLHPLLPFAEPETELQSQGEHEEFCNDLADLRRRPARAASVERSRQAKRRMLSGGKMHEC